MSESEGHLTDTHTEEETRGPEGRIGVIQSHTKVDQQPPRAGRSKEQILP